MLGIVVGLLYISALLHIHHVILKKIRNVSPLLISHFHLLRAAPIIEKHVVMIIQSIMLHTASHADGTGDRSPSRAILAPTARHQWGLLRKTLIKSLSSKKVKQDHLNVQNLEVSSNS